MSHPDKYLRLCPLQHSRYTETKKYGPNEITDKNSRKRTKNEEIDNLSDTEFKTLAIRMLTELIELGHKMKVEMKDTQSKIKENRTNSERKETRTQINDLEHKEDINTQQEQNEETRIQKNGERLRNLWENFKHSHI